MLFRSPRELHIEKSEDVIIAPYVESSDANEVRNIEKYEGYTKEVLVSCSYYTVVKIDIETQAKFNQTHAFQILSVIEGKGKINGVEITKGSHFILPYEFGEYTLEGAMSSISSY